MRRFVPILLCGCTVRATTGIDLPAGDFDLAFLLLEDEDGRLTRSSPPFAELGGAPVALAAGEAPSAFVVFTIDALTAIDPRLDAARLLEARIDLDPDPEAPVVFNSSGDDFSRRRFPDGSDVRPIDGAPPTGELIERGALVLPIDANTCRGFGPLAFAAFARTEGEITALAAADPTLQKTIFSVAIVDDRTAVASTTHGIYRLERGAPVDPFRDVLRVGADTGTHSFGLFNAVTVVPESPAGERRIIVAGTNRSTGSGLAMEVAVLPSGFEVVRASTTVTNGFQRAAIGPGGRIALVGLTGALFEWKPEGPLVDLGLEPDPLAEWPTSTAVFTRDPTRPLVAQTKDKITIIDDRGQPAIESFPGVKYLAVGPSDDGLDLLALRDDDISRRIGDRSWRRLDIELPRNATCSTGEFPGLRLTDEFLSIAVVGRHLLITVRSCFELVRVDLDTGCADVTPLAGGASSDFNVVVADDTTIVAGRENGGVVGSVP